MTKYVHKPPRKPTNPRHWKPPLNRYRNTTAFWRADNDLRWRKRNHTHGWNAPKAMISLEEGSIADYVFAKAAAEIALTQPNGKAYNDKLTAKASLDELEALIRASEPKGVYRMGDAVILKTPTMCALIDKVDTAKLDTFEYDIRCFGDVSELRAFIEGFFADKKVPGTKMIDWAYELQNSMNVEHIFMKPPRDFHPELYPYIADVNGMLDRYVDSSAPILILSGEPGTGKTSLIRHIIQRYDWKAITTYDHRVMEMDELYLSFLRGGYNCCIMEDADVLLADRLRDGNHIMSRILNVSDGLLDLSGKKMIFTANLKSLNQIDEAIMRAGRCFDVIQFRRLTADEAAVAAKAMNVAVPTNAESYSLGDIAVPQEHASPTKKTSLGFIKKAS